MDCASITVILTYCLTRDERRAFAAPHICSCCEERLDNPAWVLQALHEACHQPSPPAHAIEALLEDRYAEAIQRVATTNTLDITREIAAESPEGDARHALLFALLRSPDRGKRHLGRQMAHAILLAGAEHSPPSESAPVSSTDASLGRVLELESQIARKQETIDRLLAYIHETREKAPVFG
jgi:hypothetical protein